MPPTQWDTHKLCYRSREEAYLYMTERTRAVGCLTIKEAGDGWSVDAEGSGDGLVFTFVLNAALLMKGDMRTAR